MTLARAARFGCRAAPLESSVMGIRPDHQHYERDDAAVTNQGKVRFMIYPGGLSPERVIVFMPRLIKDAPRKVFLILDNLNVHKAFRSVASFAMRNPS
jgi:DDE superfamily endonuclease